MATEKKVAKTAEVKEVKKPAAKKTTKKEVKVSAPEKKATVTKFSKATMHDHEVIIEPIITEKTMSMSQTENKATFKVKNGANKTEIKNAIQRIYGQSSFLSYQLSETPKFQEKVSGIAIISPNFDFLQIFKFEFL